MSFYFCDNPSVQDEFIEQFLNTNKMFYVDKLNLLEFILNKHFPSFNDRYNKKIKNVAHTPKKLKNRLDDFMALRNVIAHRVVDISKETLLQSKGLYITFIKDQGVVIDKAKIQYYQDEYNYIINALFDLINNDMVDFLANRNKNPK